MDSSIEATKAKIIEDINKYLDEKLTNPTDGGENAGITEAQVKNMIDEALKN